MRPFRQTVLPLLFMVVGLVCAGAGEVRTGGWSEATANRNLAGLAEALLARDAAAAKPFFRFPLERPGLLPDVPKDEFEAYFPTLFDERFFADFGPAARERGTNLWEAYSWRGFYAPGLWSHDAVTVTDVPYASVAEEARRHSLDLEEIATLDPALREGVRRPRFAFEAGTADSGLWRGRVDEMEGGTRRLALWRPDRPLDGPPDAACLVSPHPYGQIGDVYYYPQESATDIPIEEFVPYRLEFCLPFVCLGTELVHEADGPLLELTLSEDGRTPAKLGGRKRLWAEMRREAAERKTADFTGDIPVEWPFCPPFVDDAIDLAEGFLVVEAVKPCHASDGSGVRPGDIFLAWDSDTPAPNEHLLDAWLSFLLWKRDPGGRCWFARDRGGAFEIFSCDAEALFECIASHGTFCLRLAPRICSPDEWARLEAACAPNPNGPGVCPPGSVSAE